MPRLFVGIGLPPEHRLALSAIAHGLKSARWVDPGNLHVTLRFLGEIDEGTAADIDETLAEIRLPGFALAIAGIGLFGTPSQPRVLYAGVDKSPPLARLHDKIASVLMRIGLPPDGQRFTPHVTLARLRRGEPDELQRFAAAHNLLRLPIVAVDRFQLIRSYLTKSGAIYEEIAEYPLH